MSSTLGRDAFGKVGKNNRFTAAQPLKAQQIFISRSENRHSIDQVARNTIISCCVAVYYGVHYNNIQEFSATREKQIVGAFEDL